MTKGIATKIKKLDRFKFPSRKHSTNITNKSEF